MIESCKFLGLSFKLFGKENFDTSSSWDKDWFFDHGSININSIIDGSFNILQNVPCASSQNDGRKSAVFSGSFEDNNFFRGNFLNSDIIWLTDFFRSWRVELWQDDSSYGSGDSSQLELAHNSDSHDFILVQEVKNDIRNWSTWNDNVDVGSDEFLNEFFSQIFFTFCVVKQLIGILNQDSTFSLWILSIEGTWVTCDSGVFHWFDTAFNISLNNHTTHESWIIDTWTQNLDDSYIVDIKLISGVW